MLTFKRDLLVRTMSFGALSFALGACAATQHQPVCSASGTSSTSVGAVSAYENDASNAAEEPARPNPFSERPTSAMNWMPGKAERSSCRMVAAR